MDLKCAADFSDVTAFFADGENDVRDAMIEAGENAVEYAMVNGNYPDRTGTLRASNRYEVTDGVLTLFNDATSSSGHKYAADVEARGYDVLSGAALNAEVELKSTFQS